MKWIWRVIGAVAFGLLLSACHQNGTVFAVDTTDDTVDSNPGDGACSDVSGDCSFRAAVMEANALPGVEEIRLVDGETYVLTIPGLGEDASASGDLDFTSPVVVSGNATVSYDGGFESVFDVRYVNGLVEFIDVDVAHSVSALSVWGDTSLVSIDGMEVSDLSIGFADIKDGKTFITNSTLSDVEVLLAAAPIWVTGGYLSLDNFTYVSNSTRDGIISNGGEVVVRNSTLVGRGATVRLYPASGGSLSVQSSVVYECEGDIVSLGHNVAERFCAAFGGPSDQSWVSYPTIGQLDDYGGPVQTMLIPLNSVLHDGGEAASCGLPTDARGIARPHGPACDIGAVEIQPSPSCVPANGANLRFCDFSDDDFSGQEIRNADFAGANLSRVSLAGADLSGSSLLAVDFTSNNLTNVDLSNATVTEAGLFFPGNLTADGANFSGAHIDGLYFRTADGADFTNYSGTSRVNERMIGATVSGADFSEVYFSGVQTSGLIGTPTAMWPGQGVVNGYLLAHNSIVTGADLSGTDLSSLELISLRATHANFSNVTFGATTRFADFRYANLDGADLSSTDAYQMSFRDASVVGVDLTAADLRYTWWQNATVVGADYTNADLSNATFTDTLLLWSTFDNTICPSGVNSDANGGDCAGQFLGRDPLAGAPVPESLAGMGPEDFAPGGGVDN